MENYTFLTRENLRPRGQGPGKFRKASNFLWHKDLRQGVSVGQGKHVESKSRQKCKITLRLHPDRRQD